MAKKSNQQTNTSGRKIISRNRRAHHDYILEKSYDAGLVLMGSEIKSIRDNKVNLADGFVQERGGELWLMNAHIAPYEKANVWGHTDPRRPRKLLLHKREISQIITQIRERSYTAVPTTLYLERGLAKVEIAIARGKKTYDKRESIAKRDAERDIQRALKSR
ncbi:MAG: SsrA-binding protein SmpB [Anaerolineaceae bacterium]|nr:SsrA-binding protein SmpB [Anaerolineae bacterium]MCB9459833.1 SsrA-binding protein SmpB [Anaerolineaceae bacterium]